MKVFSAIREFFWPLLEKGEVSIPKVLTIEDIKVNGEVLERTFDMAVNDYESEEERTKTVETKSSLFVGTISVVAMLVIGVTTLLVKDGKSIIEYDFKYRITILCILLFVLIIYVARTLWFAMQALERKAYETVSAEDYLIEGSKEEYFRKLIVTIVNKTSKNSITINSKVDSMTMAQEYFKRAIGVIVIYSIVIFSLAAELDIRFPIEVIPFDMSKLHIGLWNTLVLYVLVSVAIALGIYSIRKKGKPKSS